MAIATMDSLVSALASAQQKRVYKLSQTSKGAGYYQSLWMAGGEPAAGLAPVGGALVADIPTSATQGGIIYSNASGGNTAYLARFAAMNATQVGVLYLADRLWEVQGLAGNTNSIQYISVSPALTRPDSTGANNELWIEIYGATGSTQATLTVSYTNQAGTSGQQASAVIVATSVAGQMFQCPLAAGDTGVRSVQSAQLSVSTGAIGNIGIAILRRVAEVFFPMAQSGDVLDAFALGMPTLDPNSCLFFFMLCGAATTGDIRAGLSIVAG